MRWSLRGELGRALFWQAVGLVFTAGVLVAEHALSPGFWLQDDKRNQYVPVFQDIGRRVLAGEFPVIDPALGTSGNYAQDIQYGIYDPLHLAVAVVASRFDNLALLGFVLSAAFLLVLTWGTTLLAQRLGAPGAWSAACGVVAATSGYQFYWLAASWIPGLISLAWVPWLWWFWLGRARWWNLVGIAVTTYLVIAGGWPSTWLTLLALGVGVLVEWALRKGEDLRQEVLGLLVRALAATGGAVAAVVGVLPLLRSADWTIRTQGVANHFFQILNFADLLGFASPVLHGDLLTFGHRPTSLAPVYFAVWFALPLLWLVDWRDHPLRARGMVTAVVAIVLMLLLTQAPAQVGPLRNQVRQLAGAQFFMVAAVAVLLARRQLTVTRARVVGVTLSLVAVAWLTWARVPHLGRGVLVPAMLLVGLFVFGMAGAARLGGRAAAGLVALVGTVALSLGAYVWGPSDKPVQPTRVVAGTLDRELAKGPTLALFTKGHPVARERWPAQGMGIGMTRLTSRVRMAPGYSSLRQSGIQEVTPFLTAHGYADDRAVHGLFRVEPRTGRSWIDLLGYRTVVLERGLLEVWETRPGWHQVAQSKDFVVFRQEDPAVTGRVTYAADGVSVRATSVDRAVQRYRVDAPEGGALVFKDLYWPGYRATLDGAPVDVHPLGRTVLQVELPPGADGDLEVRFEPVTVPEIVGLTGAGVLLVVGACALSWWTRRRAQA